MSACRLYAILDADACEARGLAIRDVGRALCQGAPAILQLRAKDRPAGEVLALLGLLRDWTSVHRTLLFMNDRADLAELGHCDGVHVGQADLPIASIRRHFPRLRVGVSTHSEREFDQALSERPDYVALGPIFQTASKRQSEPVVGPEELARLAPRARREGVPVVAIGGIDEARAPSICPHADYAAVIAALLPPPDAGARLEAEVLSRTRRYSGVLLSA